MGDEPATVPRVAVLFNIPHRLAERIIAHAGASMSIRQLHDWVRDGGAKSLPSAKEYDRLRRQHARWRAARKGSVYFVEAVGCDRIKIGFTAAPTFDSRLRGLQTSCPFPLKLLAFHPGSMLEEYRLHEFFRDARVAPNVEWFHATPELREHIASIVAPPAAEAAE